jgi:glycosyltransferase involved in cell wall biosynthesis
MSPPTPLVSVIIPTFNRLDLLKRAIASIQEQSYQHWELIVVDDGSTDGTSAWLKHYVPTSRQIQQDNQGVSAARNHGVEIAHGQWIAFLDSDDAWAPTKLEDQMKALAEEPHYRFCHTDEIWIRRGRRVNPMNKHRKWGGYIYEHCLPRCCISPSSVLMHRLLWDESQGFDESLAACEDYDLWLRICAREPVLWLDAKLTIKYGGHDDQLSKKYWGMDRFRIQALQKMLTTNDLSPEHQKRTLDTLVEKLQILLQGAQKRGHHDTTEKYQPVLLQTLARQERHTHTPHDKNATS